MSTIIAAPNMTGLRQRAVAEWQRKVDEYDADARTQQAADFKRKIDVLRYYLRDKIGLSDDDNIQVVIAQSFPNGFVAVTADGLRFALKDLPYADCARDRERLHVSVECSRGCGKDLWVNVESLPDLGAVLQPDATNTHEFGCLQKFGDDGEPTTDMMGNPLPERAPAMTDRDVAELNARLAIETITVRADELTEAIRAEQAAIAERDDYLTALVNSLIGSPNPLTGKSHSQSSAESAAKEDARYRELSAARTDAECARLMASAAYDVAKLSARCVVAALEADR